MRTVVGVVMLGTLIGGCGAAQSQVVTRGAGGKRDTSATSSTAHSMTSTTRPSVPAGRQSVSYHDVEVQTPASWPIRDGNQTGFCSGPFPADPTVFLGPQRNGAPGCSPRPPGQGPSGVDGVWLQAGDPPADAAPVTSGSGERLRRQPAGWQTNDAPRTYYWYHGVQIVLGSGPNPAVAQRILDSVHYRPGTPDTPAAEACGLNPQPEAMPTPERLSQGMVAQQGNLTFDPPAPSERPTMKPEAAWHPAHRPGATRSPLSVYRILLTRYSGRYPATLNPDGSTTPNNRNLLAWVVYAAPVTPDVPNCGGWGADIFDANTGHELISSGWGPSP